MTPDSGRCAIGRVTRHRPVLALCGSLGTALVASPVDAAGKCVSDAIRQSRTYYPREVTRETFTKNFYSHTYISSYFFSLLQPFSSVIQAYSSINSRPQQKLILCYQQCLRDENLAASNLSAILLNSRLQRTPHLTRLVMTSS